MTRDRAKEILPVIQAYAQGKAVQYKPNLTPQSEWRDVSIIVGDCLDGDSFYRVKPEPRIWWLVVYKGTITTFEDQVSATKFFSGIGEIIRVQEVL